MTLSLESPEEIRASIRRGELARPIHGPAPRYVQAKPVVLPEGQIASADLTSTGTCVCYRHT